MTLHLGCYRIRANLFKAPAWCLGHLSWSYPQGAVHVWRFGPLAGKVMVDALSPQERQQMADRAQAWAERYHV